MKKITQVLKNISVCDRVDVAIDKYMINTTGKVVRKYTAPDTLPSGAVVYYVEIRLDNKYTVEENILGTVPKMGKTPKKGTVHFFTTYEAKVPWEYMLPEFTGLHQNFNMSYSVRDFDGDRDKSYSYSRWFVLTK